MRYKLLLSILIVLSLSACFKRYDIEPLGGNIYTYEATLASSDYENTLSECFLSLNGYAASPSDLDPTSQYASHHADQDKIDFGYLQGKLVSPASDYAGQNFAYDIDWENVSKWPSRVSTSIGNIDLSEKEFNSISDINTLVKYSSNAAEETVTITPHQCYTFNNKRFRGVFYVESGDNSFVHLKLKYVKS